MLLENKYLVGAIGLIIVIASLIGLEYLDIDLFRENELLLYFLLGIITIIIAIYYIRLLFASETIKGKYADYTFNPLLTNFEIKSKISTTQTIEEFPDRAFCSECGKEIYKPFRCQRCGKILCGSHYLQGDHECVQR